MTERLIPPLETSFRSESEETSRPLAVERKRNFMCVGCESLVSADEPCPVCDRK